MLAILVFQMILKYMNLKLLFFLKYKKKNAQQITACGFALGPICNIAEMPLVTLYTLKIFSFELSL